MSLVCIRSTSPRPNRGMTLPPMIGVYPRVGWSERSRTLDHRWRRSLDSLRCWCPLDTFLVGLSIQVQVKWFWVGHSNQIDDSVRLIFRGWLSLSLSLSLFETKTLNVNIWLLIKGNVCRKSGFIIWQTKTSSLNSPLFAKRKGKLFNRREIFGTVSVFPLVIQCPFDTPRKSEMCIDFNGTQSYSSTFATIGVKGEIEFIEDLIRSPLLKVTHNSINRVSIKSNLGLSSCKCCKHFLPNPNRSRNRFDLDSPQICPYNIRDE